MPLPPDHGPATAPIEIADTALPATDEPRSLRIEDWLTVLVMAALALITFVNVLTRYFTNSSFAWTEELSVFLMIVLALVGGFTFALTNVTLRRLHRVPGPARMLAMFGGGALLATLGAGIGMLAGIVAAPPALAPGWATVALALTVAFLLGNYGLQYGAARLAAGTTALVMLSEVLFASVSSWWLAAAELAPRTLAGGALIVLAALLATLPARRSASTLGAPPA